MRVQVLDPEPGAAHSPARPGPDLSGASAVSCSRRIARGRRGIVRGQRRLGDPHTPGRRSRATRQGGRGRRASNASASAFRRRAAGRCESRPGHRRALRTTTRSRRGAAGRADGSTPRHRARCRNPPGEFRKERSRSGRRARARGRRRAGTMSNTCSPGYTRWNCSRAICSTAARVCNCVACGLELVVLSLSRSTSCCEDDTCLRCERYERVGNTKTNRIANEARQRSQREAGASTSAVIGSPFPLRARAPWPRYSAASPSSCSMRSNWLYFATRRSGRARPF